MPFVKGKSGNPRGRKKGERTAKALAVEEFGRRFLESETYRRNVKKRILRGDAIELERLLHFYAFGKPPSEVRITRTEGTPVQSLMPFMTKSDQLMFYSILKRAQRAQREVRVIDVTPSGRKALVSATPEPTRQPDEAQS